MIGTLRANMFTGTISQNANYDKYNILSGEILLENLKNSIVASLVRLYRICIISL